MTQPSHRPAAFWPGGTSKWEPWALRIELCLPHLLLLLSTVLSVATAGQSGADRLGTLALVGVALCWVLGTDTLAPRRWLNSPVALAFSLTGLLTIAGFLMARDLTFLLFAITGFFHGIRLRPPSAMLAGVGATSLLINTASFGGVTAAFTERTGMFLTVVVVQTLAIAGGARMSEKLAEYNETRRKALDELEAAHAENAGLHRQLLAQAREAGILDERQRLSREIHDTLAQGFTGIITQLEAAELVEDDPPERRRRLATAAALARENLTEARRAVHALRPEALESAQLPDALNAVAGRWGERCSVAIEFTTTGTAKPMHPEIEATLLRITQEALSNVAKHAGATRVGLTLSYMEDQVTLDVRDDGAGFDPDAVARSGPHGGFGLSGMRQRVQRLAGHLHVESEPGGGTAISANVPAVAAVSDR
ncbi:sensor histidine kinase [Amycolatopsis nigrescens]|uniref:sensor histidine kinase n=1 Tax=Amycolatopsis nigrescens TaxID=381445 RepID=UPI00035F76EE|nr:sensor histidine kinase [Amycolatopsis nigrescens]